MMYTLYNVYIRYIWGEKGNNEQLGKKSIEKESEEMFCTRCGKEIDENWNVCPGCGMRLKGEKSQDGNKIERASDKTKTENEIAELKNEESISTDIVPETVSVEADSEFDGENESLRVRTREEIENVLSKMQSNGIGTSVIFGYGSGPMSKDLANILEPGEEIIRVYYAKSTSVWSRIKNILFHLRQYMVCTNHRLLYVEGVMAIAFRMFTFLKTAVCIPYKDITRVISEKRVGIYSGKLTIESNGKETTYTIVSHKDAEEIEAFVNAMREHVEESGNAKSGYGKSGGIQLVNNQSMDDQSVQPEAIHIGEKQVRKKEKMKKPFYKKIWFWILVIVAAFVLFLSMSNSDVGSDGTAQNENNSQMEEDDYNIIQNNVRRVLTLPVTVVNHTGVDIYYLFASTKDTDNWEEDILGENVLYAGESVVIKFTYDSAETEWDFAMADLEGNIVEFYGLNFADCESSEATLILEYDGVNGYATLE